MQLKLKSITTLLLLMTLAAVNAFAQGPLTAASNLRVRADTSGNLMVAGGVASQTTGPLTPFGNIMLRTDSSGNLLVSMGGAQTVAVNGIAATSTDGFTLANNTAATAGVPVQQSPRLRFRSNVWNTTATAANNTQDWIFESVPVSGLTPSGNLLLKRSLNGAAYATIGTWSTDGNFTSGAGLTTAAASAIGSGRYYFFSPAAGQLNVTDGTLVVGVGLDVATDETLKVRTRAQTGYADVWARLILATANYTTSAGAGWNMAGLVMKNTAPTIASGFGASPSIVASNGTAAFTINVGTGAAATTGVITMPAATTGWACNVEDLANAATIKTRQSATTTTSVSLASYSMTTGLALAWASAAVIQVACLGY